MATAEALIIRQKGSTVANAWPQVTPNGVAGQNLDLLQIIGQSGQILASVDNTGKVLGAGSNGAAITGVTVSGQTATYAGTFPAGATNALAGKTATITGFGTAGNNVTGIIQSSSATQIVLKTTTQSSQSGQTAFAIIYTPNQVRIGRYIARLTSTATLAALFALAFYNPSHLDIIQVQNEGGLIHYNLTYQGVAVGS